MGSKLWAVDIILNDIIRPMIQAYTMHQYSTASNLIYQLNSFFIGYGVGILDMKEPVIKDSTFQGIITQDDFYRTYYEFYSPIVMKSMGKYISDVIRKLDEENHMIAQ